MTQRNRAWRRQQRQKALRHAYHVINVIWSGSPFRPERWADNMKKCSCDMCSPSKYGGPSRQTMRGAAAAMQQEFNC